MQWNLQPCICEIPDTRHNFVIVSGISITITARKTTTKRKTCFHDSSCLLLLACLAFVFISRLALLPLFVTVSAILRTFVYQQKHNQKTHTKHTHTHTKKNGGRIWTCFPSFLKTQFDNQQNGNEKRNKRVKTTTKKRALHFWGSDHSGHCLIRQS